MRRHEWDRTDSACLLDPQDASPDSARCSCLDGLKQPMLGSRPWKVNGLGNLTK